MTELTPQETARITEALTARPRWRDGREAAADAADPVVGPGVDGREAATEEERGRNATRAFDPAHVVVWDEDIAFDLEGFYREDRALRPDAVDLDALAAQGVADGVLPAVALLRTTADAAIRQMRDLLVSPTHAEGRVTAFLTQWNFEQHWLGVTLAAVEQALTGRPVRAGVEEPSHPVLARRLAFDSHTRSIGVAARTQLLGEDVVTVHMAQGLLDARVLAIAFANLARRCGNDELAAVAEHAAGRHRVYAQFFREQLLARLALSGGARRLLALWGRTGRWTWPGSRYRTRAEVSEALGILLGGPSSRDAVDRVDAEFALLAAPDHPGRGSRPVRTHLRRYGFGTGPSA